MLFRSEINTEDLYATVQPGVITAKFAAAVAAKGLFYPPDPGSMSVSTIGGNVAESSGGLRGLKYGTTKDYVMGMEVFANTGDLVKTGSRTVKCATLMSYPEALTYEEARGFADFIRERVLRYSEHENPELPRL